MTDRQLDLTWFSPKVEKREGPIEAAVFSRMLISGRESRCGTAGCRGTITGVDWKRPEIQRKYDGHFSWFIQRRIDAAAQRSAET
jgi:hypothetical protein